MSDTPRHDWGSINWDDHWKRSLLFAARPVNTDSELRNRYDRNDIAEELVQDAIEKVINGTRTWDEDRISLLMCLFGTIRSDLSNIKRKYLNQESNNYDISSMLKEKEKSEHCSPEHIVSCKETKNKFIDKLKNEDKKASETLSIIIEEGITGPKEISETTDQSVEQVTNAKKRIKRKFERFLDSKPKPEIGR